MSPAPKEHIDHVRSLVREILGDRASDVFLQRLDLVLNDWAQDKLTVAQSCDKIQRNVGLFIDETLAQEIRKACAPIVRKESSA